MFIIVKNKIKILILLRIKLENGLYEPISSLKITLR